MALLSYREAVKAGIAQEMRRDESVVFIGEDVAAAGGVFKTTEGLQEEFGETLSLEPLLWLPVPGDQLMLGKSAATCVFMAVSLLLSLCSFYFALKFMPLQQLGMTPNFGPLVVVAAASVR